MTNASHPRLVPIDPSAQEQDFHPFSSFLPPKKIDEETDRTRSWYTSCFLVAEFNRFNKMPPDLVEGETINLSVHVGRVYVAFTASYKSPGHLEPAEVCVGKEQVVTPYKRIPICCNLRRYLGGSNVAFDKPIQKSKRWDPRSPKIEQL